MTSPWATRAARLALLATAAVGALQSGCTDQDPLAGSSNGSRLVIPGGAPDGAGISKETTAGGQWVMGDLIVCPSGASPVVVHDVRARDGDLKVAAFTIRPNPTLDGGIYIGGLPGDLAANDLKPTPDVTLDKQCAPQRQNYELVVQVEAGTHDTSTSGFTISYTADATRRTLEFPIETHSCVSGTTSACAHQ